MSDKKQTRQVNKSAVDGRFVSDKFAQRNPKTTFKQTVAIPKPKSK